MAVDPEYDREAILHAIVAQAAEVRGLIASLRPDDLAALDASYRVAFKGQERTAIQRDVRNIELTAYLEYRPIRPPDGPTDAGPVP